MRYIGIALLLLLAPIRVLAGEDDLKQAEQLYKQMQYTKALTAITRVVEAADNGPEQLVEGYRLSGLCLSALGRTEESVMAFRRLLAIDPFFRLSRDISPKLSPPFSKALAAEQKPITLTHNPPEAVKTLAEQDVEINLQADPLGMVATVRLLAWGDDGKEQKVETAVNGPQKIVMKLPKTSKATKVSYYLEAANKFGGVLSRAGSKDKPFELQVRVVLPPVAVGVPPSDAQAGAAAATTSKQPSTTGAADSERKSTGKPFYKTWWFWTAVGVVVAGAAAGTAVGIAKSGGGGGEYDNYSIKIK